MEPLTPARSRDPYAPPQADLTLPPSGGGPETLNEPRTVPAGRGWGWIREAWPLFARQPWPWIGAVVALMAIYFVLGLIPFVGSLVTALIGAAFTGGLAIGAHTQYGGGRFEVAHLFAGFSRNPQGLLLLGLASLGLMLAVGLVMGLGTAVALGLGGAFSGAIGPDGVDPNAMAQMAPMMLIPMLLTLLLIFPVAMLIFFSPYLVALNGAPVGAALKLSFQGCWRNIWPLTVFGLALLGLALASLLTLGLAFLVLAPVLTIAVYLAYRDIYYR
jgi:hypothetical protein